MQSVGLRIVGDDFRGGAEASARAKAILAAFSERHLPLTPSLATRLAELESVPIPGVDLSWGRAFVRAGEAMGIAGQVGSAFWSAAMPVFATSVAEPILRHAARQVGHMTLVGAAGLSVASDPYLKDTDASIEAAVDSALGDVAVMGRGFWIVTGVALHGVATRATEARAGLARKAARVKHLAPEPDAGLCRLLFETEPVFPDDHLARQRRQRARAKSMRKRSGIRPKEGGVAGIRASRRIEDFPDAVFSELIMPIPLLANRLLHEGLLVRHRPPMREPKRDLLSMCFCDASGVGAANDLVKAAWADAGLRLRLILSQLGLARSDLVWAEAGPFSPMAAVLRTEEVTLRAGLDPMQIAGPLRADILMRSGLLPGFTDTLPVAARLDAAEGFSGHLSALASLGLDALKDRARRMHRTRDGAAPVLRVAEYARHLVLVSLPASSPEGRRAITDWPALRAEIRAGLQTDAGEGATYAALLYPGRMVRGAVFTAISDAPALAQLELQTPEDGDAALCVSQTLGLLSGWVIDLTLEALDGR